ncbi:host attachment protein [Marinobacterium aestuariivivens]|uniref:Host attachment protein n=1 Tax=Marinobacterium aestuariivivens TaxID=1698799 RepID=A0ABW1ZYG7_9GAMM
MPTTWILAANRSHARIFSADTPAAGLTEVESLLHEEGRLHEGDLVSDGPGISSGVAGRGGNQMNRDETARHQEAQQFGRQICGLLDEGLRQKRFDQLYILCEPGFLGLIRPILSPGLKQHLKSEIQKNLVAQTPEEIRSALPQYL